MKLAFFLIAAVMVAVAAAVVILPLLRHGRRLGRPRAIFVLALGALLVIPLGSLLLYRLVGTPSTLDGVPRQPPAMNVQQALAELHDHLAQHPDDLQGWLLLAQSDTAMQQPAAARDAYEHALKLAPDNTEAMVGWAEADATQQPNHVIGERGRALLLQAVTREPDNQRGLWLLGISQFQQDRYADAAASWRKLQPLLEPGSTVAQAVAQQIALADQRSGAAPASAASSLPAAAASASSPPADAHAGPALQVQISLAPALKAKLSAGDTLFVYARAPSGPPMPLAVAKLDAQALPASVTLTDAMAMTPQRRLSSVPQAFVGARISHSGQAIAQAGDLEGDAGVVPVDGKQPVSIVIDRVH